eukprot:jgi/Botrbrau1/2111/Bobra.0093s0018.1
MQAHAIDQSPMLSFVRRNLQRSPQFRHEGALILGWTGNFGHGLATTATSPPSEPNRHVQIDVHPFKAHRLEPPSTRVETSRDELLDMFKLMNIMRRSEITADLSYKQKLIRGFLHLADGQEAVPVGMETALDYKDSIIQSYRDHTTFLGRGGTVKELFAELFGKVDGCARGLGGPCTYTRRHTTSTVEWASLAHRCPSEQG